MTAARPGYLRVKRTLDVLIAAALLTLTAPVMLAVAVAVAVAMGRPILFRQVRPGQGGRLFVLVKFRSMRPVRPVGGSVGGPVGGSAGGSAGGPVGDAARLTPLGRWLRATSLDELPTLWNVLRGEMSLVGPRPLPAEYLDRYTPEQFRRHEVRPGITGLAQVSGRNALSWEEKFGYDIRYVENLGLGLDLRILVRTVVTVLRREGITAPGQATAREYLGSAGVATTKIPGTPAISGAAGVARAPGVTGAPGITAARAGRGGRQERRTA